jgi:hypothetical protein
MRAMVVITSSSSCYQAKAGLRNSAAIALRRCRRLAT